MLSSEDKDVDDETRINPADLHAMEVGTLKEWHRRLDDPNEL